MCNYPKNDFTYFNKVDIYENLNTNENKGQESFYFDTEI